MKRKYYRNSGLFSILCLFTALAVGCQGGGLEQKLVGKWDVDSEKMKEIMEKELDKTNDGTPGDAIANQMIENMVADMEMSFEFTDSGKATMLMSMSGHENKSVGNWSAISSSGNDLVIRVADDKDKVLQEGTITFLDDDTIQLKSKHNEAGGPMEVLVFKRSKS